MPVGPDPELGLNLAKALVDIYAGAVLRLLGLVADRLARGIDQPGWAETKLLETAQLRDQAQAVVERLARDGPPAAAQAITEAFEAGAAEAEHDLDRARELQALHRQAVDVAVAEVGSDPRRRNVEQLVAETVSRVQSTHLQIVRNVEDAYRDVINEVASPGVVVGEATRREAAQRALDRFADRGIKGFRDRAGREWELASYAEMAVRTGIAHAQVAGALQRFTEAGRDLVIVSDAPEECVICRPWEGAVLSISGSDPDHDSIDSAVAAGLWHPNCRHAIGAFIPGLTRKLTGTPDPHGDTIRQEQRRLERRKRADMRDAAVALSPEAKRTAAAMITRTDRELALIVRDRHAYALERAAYFRDQAEHGVRGAAASAKRWAETAAGIEPGRRGKRLRYREQVSAAR